VATRQVAEQLTKALGQNFYVDNKPGAGGNLGTEAAARSAPDGYTLTMGTNATHGTNQFLYQTVPFDAEKDFEPIILIGSFPMAIAANPSYPANSIPDIIAAAKAKPNSAGYRHAEHDRAHRVRAAEGAVAGAAVRHPVQGVRYRDHRSHGGTAATGDRYRDRSAAARRRRQAQGDRRDVAQADRALARQSSRWRSKACRTSK
jgi:tripartite-type tricarboxylate transporter receptor subunit TctC